MPDSPLHAHVGAARTRLREAGIADPEADLDARLLAQAVLGWDTARLLAAASDPPPPDFAALYEALVERRLGREPMAYILGRQEFWGLDFEVGAAVLIPRPETELVVEAALELFADPAAPLRIADIGTGSGCLAVALAHERPHAHVIAGDRSADALAIARRNAVRHGLADRIRFVLSDLFAEPAFDEAPLDLVVSNPPYVPESDRATLQPEVRDHEPGVALFAGPDGLTIIRQLVADAVPRLAGGGALVFEFGFGQADAVSGLISRTPGLTMVALRRDLQGIPRAAIARRTP